MYSRNCAAPAALALAALSGCAGLPADWGRGQADRYAAEHGWPIPRPADAADFTRALLAQPLTADAAVQLALVNNPAMRAQTAELGIAAAEVYDAGRLANPSFSAARLSPGDAAAPHAQLTLGIAVNFVNLLFLPANHRYATDRFEAAKLSVGAAALQLAADTESGWYRAVGSAQRAEMRERVARAGRASAELAQRYFDAGNISSRELAMQQAAASQAELDLLSARADAVSSRSALNRLMGLNAAQDLWPLDARLPEPYASDAPLLALQRLAADSRLDVAAARRRAEALATRYGLVRQTRLVDSVELGVERERDYDGAINVGPTITLSLPLFNWGSGRATAAQAALAQAEAKLDGLVLDSSNEVKQLHARLIAARDRAAVYRQKLIPQREEIVARMNEEVRYMLLGVFDLLLAKQQEYDAYAGYLGAIEAYWSTRAELARAVGRELPGDRAPLRPALAPEVPNAVAPAGPAPAHDMDSMPGMDMGAAPDGGQPAAAPEAAHSQIQH